MTLTPRDIDIAYTLTRRVRLLTLDQVVQLWWFESCSYQTAWHRLRALAREQWVQLATINLITIAVEEPLVAWQPGQEEPNAEAISHAAQVRWNGVATPTAVVFAGPRAANVYASNAGRLAAVNHRNHDAHLGAVYTVYRTQRSHEAVDWVGEDARPKAGFRIKDPDAWLIDSGGRPYRVIESAGAYTVAQVQAFHEHCVEHELPYELW
jgi:hypothetical protein